jgi:hypothetical protein
VIDRCSVELVQDPIEGFELPLCAVRSRCRWFDQLGSRACQVCLHVVTDASESIQSDLSVTEEFSNLLDRP